MSDFSSDFDAHRVGWWERRSAVRRLKRTSWLTGADRDLRVQRARAAHTRGELNALTRDLDVGRPGAHAQPEPIPPPVAQSYGQVPQYSQATARPQQAATQSRRSLRTSLLVGGLVLLVTCGGGLVSCVSAIVDTVSESSSGSSGGLLSEDGWNEMIGDLDDSVGVRSIVDAVVRDEAATVGLPDSDDSVLRYYYDGGGDVEATGNAVRNPARALFDLFLVDGLMVEDAIDQARQGAGVTDTAEALVHVSATEADQPTLMVTFPDDSSGYSLVVDLDGTIVSENGVS